MDSGKKAVLWVDLTKSRSGIPPPEVAEQFTVHQLRNAQRIDSTIHDVRPLVTCFEYDDPDHAGLAVLAEIKRAHPELPVLVTSAEYSLVIAVYALRARVLDYVVEQDSLADRLRALILFSRTAAGRSIRQGKPVRA